MSPPGKHLAAADTFTGKLKGISAAVEDSAAKFAQKYGPALTVARDRGYRA